MANLISAGIEFSYNTRDCVRNEIQREGRGSMVRESVVKSPVPAEWGVWSYWYFWFAWFGRSYDGSRGVLSVIVDFTFFCLVGLPVTG